jgi:hypothetical protein
MAKTQLVHIRMPTAFHRKLLRDASRAGQTLNAEILHRLEDSYLNIDRLQKYADDLQKNVDETRWNRKLLEALAEKLKDVIEKLKDMESGERKKSTVSSTMSSTQDDKP